MDEQLKTDRAASLDACASSVHPLLAALCANYPMRYYWTVFQSEWAMDIVFRDPAQLRRLYPQLIHLGMVGFSSPDVMRFMDKKVSEKGKTSGPHMHEVVSDMKVRSEGVRIKHRLGKNSIKLYDKAYSPCGAVLRPEVTLNAPGQFRVFRHKAGEDEGPMQWRPLRAGIADLHRRAEVSQKALDAIAPLWPVSTTPQPCLKSPLRSKRECAAMADLSARCTPSNVVIWNCFGRWGVASSPLTACATAICRRCFTPNQPQQSRRLATVPPLSAASSGCFALTASSANCPIPIATSSAKTADSGSTPSFLRNAPPLSSLRPLPHEIVAPNKEIKV